MIDALEMRRLFTVTVPSGYAVSTFASGLNQPTAMAFAPDGRLFVAEKPGDVRVVDASGQLEATPFVTLQVDTNEERGVIGVTLDPNFETNHFVYVYYTSTDGSIHNRLSRFTADGNVAAAGSETVLLDLPTLGAANHNGGALAFGPDGKLYLGVGDNAVGENSPSLDTPFGKILRLNSDGSVPSDNPFLSQTTGVNQYIWAKGLRNPFTIDFSPGGELFINDVGEATFEEIDIGAAGADYGWPSSEGATTDPGITGPIYTYGHKPSGEAIIGGAFLDDGFYYFGDLNEGFIRRMNVSTREVSDFGSGLDSPVAFDKGPDGALYTVSVDTGDVTKIAALPVSPPPPVAGPVVTVKAPKKNYVAGKPQAFSFSAKDGGKSLAASGFSYHVDVVSSAGTTNLVPETSGKKSVKATVPTTITGTDDILRLTLTATGADGGVTTMTTDVQPSVRTLTARAVVGKTTADGVTLTPVSITAIAGTQGTFVAAEMVGDLLFSKWSGVIKGKTATLMFTVPDKDGEALAVYTAPKVHGGAA